MTRERLRSLPREELERLAEKHGVELEPGVEREELITLTLEAYEEIEREEEQSNNQQVKVEAKKYRVVEEDDPPTDLPAIPEDYNETRLIAIARDPSWAFAYWEIKPDKMRQLKREPERTRLVLRVHDITGVEFKGKNSLSSFDIPLKLTDNRWYINVPAPGASYVMELIVKKKNKEMVLVRSNVIRTPRDGFMEETPHGGTNGAQTQILKLSLRGSTDESSGSETIPHRILAGSD